MDNDSMIYLGMIVDKQVKHKLFGNGTIISLKDNKIVVDFSGKQKLFQFPAAFRGFLITEDEDFQRMINDALEAQEQENNIRKKAEEERIANAMNRVSTIYVQNNKERRLGGDTNWTSRTTYHANQSSRESVAFKCTFCDGGSSDTCIGFRGQCSDKMIRCNVEQLKRVWCSIGSVCKKYYDDRLTGHRNITRKDLDQYCNPDGVYGACYESSLLNLWRMGAGVHHTGPDAGKPMHLSRMKEGSLAVMTTRRPQETEAERFVFAVWLVNEVYNGDEREEGFVSADPVWRIELLPGQAEKILFWNYYFNKNKPDKIVFGSGLHRYLTDIEAAQILRDIAAVKQDDFSKQFFMHFCEINGINPDDLPLPSGALMRPGM